MTIREVIESVPCPECKAEAGEPCAETCTEALEAEVAKVEPYRKDAEN
jgi:hypothetical protein